MHQSSMRASRPGFRMSVLAGSVTVIGGFLYLLYRNHLRAVNPDHDLPRDTLLQMLREFRREFYSLCKQISVHSENLQREWRARGVDFPNLERELTELYNSEKSGVPERIRDIENKVYLKFDITSGKDFQRYYEALAKTDPEVRQYKEEMHEMFRKSVLGRLPVPYLDLPSHITPAILVAAHRIYVRRTLEKHLEVHSQFVEQNGEVNPRDPEYHRALDRLQLDVEGDRIAREFGINFRDDFHPFELLRMVLAQLQKEDAKFAKKIKALETFKEEVLAEIMVGRERQLILERIQGIDAVGLPTPPDSPLPQPKDHAQEKKTETLPDRSTDSGIALSMKEVLQEVPVIEAPEHPTPHMDGAEH